MTEQRRGLSLHKTEEYRRNQRGDDENGERA